MGGTLFFSVTRYLNFCSSFVHSGGGELRSFLGVFAKGIIGSQVGFLGRLFLAPCPGYVRCGFTLAGCFYSD